MNRLWINFHRLLGQRETDGEGNRRFATIFLVIGVFAIIKYDLQRYIPHKEYYGPYYGTNWGFDGVDGDAIVTVLLILGFLLCVSIFSHIVNWVIDGYVKDGYTSEYYEGKIKSFLGAIGIKKGGNKLTKELTSTGIVLGIIALFYFTNPTYDHHKIELSNSKTKKASWGKSLVGSNPSKDDKAIGDFVDDLVGQYFNFELWLDELVVDDYYLFSVGRIKYRGNKVVSLGLVGNVFIID